MGYIESGKADGAKVLTGGERKGNAGYFVEPTIFTDVKPDMKIIREEIFGPVCAVIKFKDEQEVIDLANDTTYGLSSTVFTENISRAIRVAHALEAGQTFVSAVLTCSHASLLQALPTRPQINSSVAGSMQVPFGGYKQSGFGKELGQYALDA